MNSETRSAPSNVPDQWLTRFREIVAAAIAGVVILGTVILIGIAVWRVDSSDSFARVKDLLLFVNPLVGVVIGYYFHKVTSEARAENAESSARNANLDARQALEERSRAEIEANQAREHEREAESSLLELEQAAEKYLAQGTTYGQPSGTLSGNDNVTTVSETDVELRAALVRARRTLNR